MLWLRKLRLYRPERTRLPGADTVRGVREQQRLPARHELLLVAEEARRPPHRLLARQAGGPPTLWGADCILVVVVALGHLHRHPSDGLSGTSPPSPEAACRMIRCCNMTIASAASRAQARILVWIRSCAGWQGGHLKRSQKRRVRFYAVPVGVRAARRWYR